MGILKNSSIVITGLIIANILAYILHIYVGRILGPSDYGVFGVLIALLMIATFPAQPISSAIAKFTAKFNIKNNIIK